MSFVIIFFLTSPGLEPETVAVQRELKDVETCRYWAAEASKVIEAYGREAGLSVEAEGKCFTVDKVKI